MYRAEKSFNILVIEEMVNNIKSKTRNKKLPRLIYGMSWERGVWRMHL